MKEREDDRNLENRIFVGGLSWDVTERQLEDAFERYGKIIECQIMIEKDTGRSRGFGFITFTDRRGADDAINHMNGSELDDRVISVNKAEPKVGGDDGDHFRKGSGGYSSRGRESYGVAEDGCFNCGRPGHWARDCPSTGGDRGRSRSPLPMRSRIREFDGHRDRYGDRELGRENERYMDGRRDGGRSNYRDHRDRYRFEDGDKYDHYPMERYGPPRERFDERYGFHEHNHLDDDYSSARERGYHRDRYGRGASDRYMEPSRNEGRDYRSRPGPYDRPSRSGGRSGGRSSSYDRW